MAGAGANVDATSPTFGQPLGTGSPRIMFSMSSDGGWSWTARRAIDAGNRTEHYSSLGREHDHSALRPSGTARRDHQRPDESAVAGDVLRSAGGTGPAGPVVEGLFISGIARQMDVRVARINPGTGQLLAPSAQVSQYPIVANSSPVALAETAPGYASVHRPNLTMYSGGFFAFFGDYPDLAPSMPLDMVPAGSGRPNRHLRWPSGLTTAT